MPPIYALRSPGLRYHAFSPLRCDGLGGRDGRRPARLVRGEAPRPSREPLADERPSSSRCRSSFPSSPVLFALTTVPATAICAPPLSGKDSVSERKADVRDELPFFAPLPSLTQSAGRPFVDALRGSMGKQTCLRHRSGSEPTQHHSQACGLTWRRPILGEEELKPSETRLPDIEDGCGRKGTEQDRAARRRPQTSRFRGHSGVLLQVL